MNIGIDIDGVIANIEPYVFEYGSKLLYDKGRSLENINKERYETYEIYGWDRHDDGHESQGLHDVVLVVRNDGGKGLCHRVKDVSINICHLNGLLGFNQGVLK